MTNHQNIRRHSMRDAIRTSVFATLILAACDTNVTNPGPVNDEFHSCALKNPISTGKILDHACKARRISEPLALTP